jgi:hypothetical protein
VAELLEHTQVLLGDARRAIDPRPEPVAALLGVARWTMGAVVVLAFEGQTGGQPTRSISV